MDEKYVVELSSLCQHLIWQSFMIQILGAFVATLSAMGAVYCVVNNYPLAGAIMILLTFLNLSTFGATIRARNHLRRSLAELHLDDLPLS